LDKYRQVVNLFKKSKEKYKRWNADFKC
jgi:hypothetical protein